MRKPLSGLMVLLGTVGLSCLCSTVQAAAITADASLDWSTLQVQVVPLSGAPTLTWNVPTQTGFVQALAAGLSDYGSASDWMTSVSANANDGSSSNSSVETATGLSSSIATDGGFENGGAYRYGNFTISGGDAVVTMIIDTGVDFHIDANIAKSWVVSASSNLYINSMPTGNSSTGSETRYSGANINVGNNAYVINAPPVLDGLSSGPLHASMYFADGESGSLSASTFVSTQESSSFPVPAPVPPPFVLFGSAVIALFGISRRRVT